MKERPILFSAPMVRSILEGRKTQTRRVIKQPGLDMVESVIDYNGYFTWDTFDYDLRPLCPYGHPGDRLWVRETFGISAHNGVVPFYKATEAIALVYKWKPSIHMPRWASRITLEIVNVRVERLQDISAEDCIAEGVLSTLREHDAVIDLRDKYRALWESINGPGSWEINPWAWVIEFKRID